MLFIAKFPLIKKANLPFSARLYTIVHFQSQRIVINMAKVLIKTPEEIAKMRVAGQLAAAALTMIEPYVGLGVTTAELDQRMHDYIVNDLQAIPASLHYNGFPKSVCTSINHQVCHGIPDDRKLRDGDILNIDVTVKKDGYIGDTSRMYLLGKPSVRAQRLCQVTQECLYLGIRAIKPGARLGDIGAVIQKHAEKHHFSIVRAFCGHGIGCEMHEDLEVLHFGKPGTGIELVPGMTFTIEPMVNAGKPDVKILADGWTVVTRDHSLSAQYEHTLLVTDTGFEILTLREEERQYFP